MRLIRRVELRGRQDELGTRRVEGEVMHNGAVSGVSETNSVATSPIEETHDESIWGVDETNSVATRRIGAIHADTIWKVDATNSVDNETARNNGSTSRKTNLVSDLTSYY